MLIVIFSPADASHVQVKKEERLQPPTRPEPQQPQQQQQRARMIPEQARQSAEPADSDTDASAGNQASAADNSSQQNVLFSQPPSANWNQASLDATRPRPQQRLLSNNAAAVIHTPEQGARQQDLPKQMAGRIRCAYKLQHQYAAPFLFKGQLLHPRQC